LWKSFRDKLHLLRELSVREWLSMAEAWWLLLFFDLAFRLVSFERLTASTRPLTKRTTAPPDALEPAQQLKRLVDLAARLHLLPMVCAG